MSDKKEKNQKNPNLVVIDLSTGRIEISSDEKLDKVIRRADALARRFKSNHDPSQFGLR